MGLTAVPAAAETDGVRMRDTSAQDRVVAAGPARSCWARWAFAIALVVFAMGALAGWQHWHGAERSVAAERLRLATVERGDFVRDIGVQGTIVAAVSPTLFAPSSGTVTLAVQAGDSVEAGQGPVVEPALVLAATFGGCWLLYEWPIRRVGFLRPLFGLKNGARPGARAPVVPPRAAKNRL